MTDRTITNAELQRFAQAIAGLVDGLGLEYLDAAHLAAVDLREPGWLFVFEEDVDDDHSVLLAQLVSDPADIHAAIWAGRHLFAIDLTTTQTRK